MTVHSTPFVWCGPIYEPTGYADEARGLLRALDEAKVPVALRAVALERPGFRDALDPAHLQLFARQQAVAIEPPVMVCQHAPADAFVPDVGAALNIGRTMFETDSLPPRWVQRCNDMDELWVPSSFNQETFTAAGVRTSIVVVPGGIDAERYHPKVPPLAIDGLRGTVFLSVFEWRYRKGWDVLLRAWAGAFGPDDDVTLLLRTYPIGALDVRDRAAVIDQSIEAFLQSACGRGRTDVAPIVTITQMLPDDALPALYARADAYVSPTRGEGWGRPFMEAMATGKPVIATRWSAHLDFMNDDNSLLVDLDGLVDTNDPEMPLYASQQWAAPSVAHLVTQLQRVHRDRAEAREIGAVARADMVSEWPWSRPAGVIAARVRELGVQRQSIVSAGRSRAPVARGPLVVVDAALFDDHDRCPLDIDAWLTPLVAADPRVRVVSPSRSRRPSRWSAQHVWWERRLLDDTDVHPRAVTLSILRRSDAHAPQRPQTGRWVVATGDVAGVRLADEVALAIAQADEVWVPHDVARRACIAAGVSPDALWTIPRMPVDAAHLTAMTRLSRPAGGGTVIGLVLATDADLGAADALVRTWERAYAARTDVVLRVVLGAAPTPAVRQWHAELVERYATRAPSARVDVWPAPLSDDLWPSMLRACDALITPGLAPAVPALWPLCAALGVPLIAPDASDSDTASWVMASGGWAVPIAGTGRFNWSALATAVEAACGSRRDGAPIATLDGATVARAMAQRLAVLSASDAPSSPPRP